MTKEEILKYQIELQYGNVKHFCNVENIPYSTVRNIFTRGFSGVGVSTAIKICRALNLDLDALMEDKFAMRYNEQKESVWHGFVNAMNSGSFSRDDMVILEHAQNLTQDQKKSLLALLESMSVKPPQEDASALPESEEESP